MTALSNQVIPGISTNTTQLVKSKNKVTLPQMGTRSTRQAYILSMAFNEKDKVLALCSTDALIFFYRIIGNNKDFKLFKTICSCGISG